MALSGQWPSHTYPMLSARFQGGRCSKVSFVTRDQSEEMAHVPVSSEPGERRLEKCPWIEEQGGYLGGGGTWGKIGKARWREGRILAGSGTVHREGAGWGWG